jgi:hypothetical protein
MIVEDERHLYLCADDFDNEQFDGINKTSLRWILPLRKKKFLNLS